MVSEPSRAGRIGAVVLTHGATGIYANIVSDLIQAGLPADELLVVHNPVEAADPVPTVPDGASVIRMDGNLGYAVGMNAGLRYHMARGADFVWVLTHEVRLRSGALDAMRAAARTHPELGALGSVLVNIDSDVVFSRGGRRSAVGDMGHRGYGSALEPAGHAVPGQVTECDWVDGASILFRSSALAGVGLYDERLFGYGEDSDLCLRLQNAGWRVGAATGAVVEQASATEIRSGAVAFLVTRNGLRQRRQVAGLRGVAVGLWRCSQQTVRAISEAVRRSPSRARRRVLFARTVSSWAGVAAFLCGRWGRPPSWLPGLGDMKS